MLERNTEEPRPQGKVKGFMYDHGRVVANGSSYLRLALGIGSAVAILTDRYRLAQGLHFVGVVTDKFDGTAAGMSKGGKTKEGGKLDQQVDKAFTAATEIALVIKGDLDSIHPVLRTERDVIMNTVVRPSYEEQGIETSAAPAGQNSTAAVLIVDNLTMSRYGRNHPRVMGALHWAATGLKWHSIIDSPRVWEQRHSEKIRQSNENVVYETVLA